SRDRSSDVCSSDLLVTVSPPTVTLAGQLVSLDWFMFACVNRALADTIPNVMPGGYLPSNARFCPPVPWLDTARISPVLGRTTTMDAGCGRPASARSALRW